MLGLLVCLVTASLHGQDDRFQKFPAGVEESIYAPVAPGEAQFRGASVMPPSWFVDLPTRQVDVLIYDLAVGAQTFTVEGQGARLLKTVGYPNGNYVKLSLLVDASAKPTTLQLRRGDGKAYPFELAKARRPQALRSSDLIYLIMPDRFANGEPSNDVLAGMTQRGVDRGKVLFRHGGDLQGVTAHLDYLSELGVTALWLNPVLENDQPYESYHGYAATDHYRVDDRLGGNAAYQTLIDSAHARGIKVLMDMVPNHVGDRHFLYADMPDRSWWHLPDSFTRSNFRIPSVLDPHAAPSDQRQMLNGWFDKHMPDFDQDAPDVRRYFTQLALWWVGATGQDGYRVDTYPYSDPAFMAEWSRELKANFPTLCFFGEVWVDGLPNQAAFVPGVETAVDPGGNTSVTDFQLKDAIMEALQQEQSWVGGVGKLWLTLTQDYLYEDPNALVTFLDNHDLSRLATSLGGDEAKLRSAITLLLTLRGTPMLYYGTELALEGAGGGFGEGGRIDMPGGWEGDGVDAFANRGLSPKQASLLRYTQRLGQYRRANPDLFEGEMMHWVPEDGVYVFSRKGVAGRRLLIVYNSNGFAKTTEFGRYLGEAPDVQLRDVMTDAIRQAGPLEIVAKGTAVFEIVE